MMKDAEPRLECVARERVRRGTWNILEESPVLVNISDDVIGERDVDHSLVKYAWIKTLKKD